MAQLYYSAFTVQASQVPSTQTNFPVLLKPTDNRFRTTGNGGHVANANGYDLRPYSDSALTTALTFELVPETYSATTGTFEMWVKVPSLSTGYVIYLGYGDTGLTTNGSSTATWDSNFKLVTHLGPVGGGGLNANDSTSNAVNGTVTNATLTTVKIDGGASFDGAGDYIDFGDTVDFGTANLTISFWHQCGVSAVNGQRVVDKYAFGPGYSVNWPDPTAGIINITISDGTDLAQPQYTISSPTALHHFAWTVNKATALGITFLIDGATQAPSGSGAYDLTTIGDITNTGHQLGFGSRATDNPGNYLLGTLDEVHISGTNRSVDWLVTEYNNQNAPGTFYAVGTETAVGGGGGGAVNTTRRSKFFFFMPGTTR